LIGVNSSLEFGLTLKAPRREGFNPKRASLSFGGFGRFKRSFIFRRNLVPS